MIACLWFKTLTNQTNHEFFQSRIQRDGVIRDSSKHQRRVNQVTAFGHRDILPSNTFPALKLKNYLTNKLQCQMKLSLKSSTKASNVLTALDWNVFIGIVPAGNMSVWKNVTVPTKEVFWWLNVQQQIKPQSDITLNHGMKLPLDN